MKILIIEAFIPVLGTLGKSEARGLLALGGFAGVGPALVISGGMNGAGGTTGADGLGSFSKLGTV